MSLFSTTSRLMGLFVLCLVFTTCGKINYRLDSIDPDTDPEALSRALLIERAVLHDGDAPPSDNDNALQIVNSQTTALITADNYLFLPFIYNPSSEVKGVYLQIEGAGTYWEIPIEPQTAGNQSVAEVLSIGIPANVIDGVFFVNYSLYGENGNTGNVRSLATTVQLPQNFCSEGLSFPRVEGSDGLFNQTYSFGEQDAGFITIAFDTYSIPDRVDVRYDNTWIRSTGDILSDGAAPPIKECSQAEAGDGFLGQANSFTFYYDPEISTKVDVYVSGCLDGGTAWWFEVRECPTDKAILGIHSKVDPSSVPIEWVLIQNRYEFSDREDLGHAWISLTKDNQTTFYGLWPDNAASVDNGPDSDVRTNEENGFGRYARFVPLNTDQESYLEGLVSIPQEWSYSNTCATFATWIYEQVTEEQIDAVEEIIGFGTSHTPRMLTESILLLENQSPTENNRPEGIPNDDSSCSFCW